MFLDLPADATVNAVVAELFFLGKFFQVCGNKTEHRMHPLYISVYNKDVNKL